MSAQKARLGFVGLGIMGRDLLKAAVADAKAEIGALCDIEAAALSEAGAMASGARQYTDYAEMLAAGGLDGVVVATPQHLHAEMSIAALKAGYHTFCEKPMALSVRSGATMIEAAKQAGKGLMIGQVLRYIGVIRFVFEQATSGAYGRAVAMRTIRTSGPWGPPWIRPWRMKEATSGGMLYEVNIHEIDLILGILGEATSVYAAGGRYAYPEVDYEDIVTATVTFAGGGVASITSACSDMVGRHTAEVWLEKGTIYYDSLSNQVYIGKRDGTRQTIPYAEVLPDAEGGVPREMREFIEACLGEHEVTISGERGLRAVEVCEAAYRSVRERRPIALPLPRA